MLVHGGVKTSAPPVGLPWAATLLVLAQALARALALVLALALALELELSSFFSSVSDLVPSLILHVASSSDLSVVAVAAAAVAVAMAVAVEDGVLDLDRAFDLPFPFARGDFPRLFLPMVFKRSPVKI